MLRKTLEVDAQFAQSRSIELLAHKARFFCYIHFDYVFQMIFINENVFPFAEFMLTIVSFDL